MDNSIVQEPHSEILPGREIYPHAANPLSVLIADDSEVFRADLKSYLEGVPGIEVIGEAGNGMRAIYLAQSLKPDLVLLDIAMPGVAGPEAAKLIRRLRPGAGSVVMTIHEEHAYSDIASRLKLNG